MAAIGSTGVLGRLRWVILLLGAVIVYGVGGYMALEGWSFLDALYMTISTLTTVGFREVRPLDTSGRVFTITLIVAGVAIALVSIALLAQMIGEGEFGGRSRRRRMQRRIDEMRDHFIVCAYGRVGRAVARELGRDGVPFVVIDPKEDLRERLEADGVAYIADDPSSEEVLRAAGVQRARGLVCAVDSDASNVYITLMARSMNPNVMIVARASEPGSEVRLEHAGADRIVSPYVSSGRHMAIMALRPEIVDALDTGSHSRGLLSVEERFVEEGSPLVSATVGDAAANAPVLAVRRASGHVVPNPPADLPLHTGDLVLLLERPGDDGPGEPTDPGSSPSGPGTPPP